MTELLSKAVCILSAVFFAAGAYGFFQVQSGTAAFMTLLCLIGCVGAIIGSFHCYPDSPME